MNRELLSFVRENALLSPGDRVACAVSGGPDSMCMLWALYQVREALGISLSCVHYDHGLRPGSADDAAFVRDFCAEYEIPFVCGRGDVAREALPGESVELAARRLRYAFLESAAPEGLIATAHTADDNLETVLLRLTRGTSLRGLGGIPVRQGRIIRPILFAERRRVLEFLASEGVPYRTDETNDTDFCPRNRIRRHVIPLLRAENPNVAAQTLSLSRTLRAEDACLSALAGEALDGAAVPGGWSCERLNALDPVLRRRALFAVLQACGAAEPAERHLELLDALVSSPDPSARASFPGGLTLARRYDLLAADDGAPGAIDPVSLPVPGTVRVPGFTVTCAPPAPVRAVQNAPYAFSLRYAAIRGGLTVRSRRTGDRLQLPGGSRSLKRLMIDRKIPAAARAGVPVLAVGAEIAAAAFIGADQRYLAQPGELAVEITIEKEEKTYAE